MKHQLIFFVLIFFVLSGCNHNISENEQVPMNNKRILLGTWQLSDLSKPESNSKEGEDMLLKEAEDKKMVKEGLIISFFPDSSFTQVKGTGEYESGKWYYANKGKSICFSSLSRKDTVFVKYEIINNQQFMNLVNPNKDITMSFIKYVDVLADYSQDPFYPANNSWRIKPNQPETDEQLHQRLGNYIKHVAYLLKTSHERQLSVLSYVFSQGIIKIYQNAVGIYPLEIIPQSWKNTYYNEEEAQIAYEMYDEYLRISPYKGAKTGEWVIVDYDILTSIYGDVKAGKFPKRKNK